MWTLPFIVLDQTKAVGRGERVKVKESSGTAYDAKLFTT